MLVCEEIMFRVRCSFQSSSIESKSKAEATGGTNVVLLYSALPRLHLIATETKDVASNQLSQKRRKQRGE